MRVGLLYDFANPGPWAREPSALYQRTLDQAVWAEELGIDALWVTEHHFVEGYAPTPTTLVAMLAARTQRARLGTAVLVGPLHHPVRLAEQLAVIDLVSGGRVELGIGLGWAIREYACFGVDPQQRVSVLHEIVDVLRLAWTGDTFSYKGRHFQFEDVRMLPKPVQRPHPPIWGGATSPDGAHRVARWGLGLQWLDPAVSAAYLDAWAEQGLPGDEARIEGYLNLLVCDDPEAVWPQVREHFRWQAARSSAGPRAIAGGGVEQRPEPTIEEIEQARAEGRLLVLTPQEAVAEIRRRSEGLPVNGVFCHNAVCGMPDELSDRHVELLATEVAPALREG